MKNRVVIQIMGQPYSITADETREYMEQVGMMTDQEMQRVLGASSHMPKMNAAVLAALNLCDQCLKNSQECKRLQEQLEAITRETEKQERNDDDARKEIHRLRSEVLELRQKLKKLEGSKKPEAKTE